MAHRRHGKSTASQVVRVKSKVDVDSLVMLREDGTNDPEWHNALDIYFQGKYEFIGFCLSDENGYIVRTMWTEEDFAEYQLLTGCTNVQLAAFRRQKVEELMEQRKKDLMSYCSMYGTIKKTLHLNTMRTLREDPGFGAVEALKKPRELVALIRSAIVTQSAGLTAEAKGDQMIRRWQKLKCGDREDAQDFCARAEELWNALTVANHPEKPELPSAIRFVTKLLTGNPAYGPYVADVLNKWQNPVTAPGAFAASFATIPNVARRFVSTGPRHTHNPTQAFAYSTAEICSGCGSDRHTEDTCWTLHPELRPSWAEKKPKGNAKQDAGEGAETKQKKEAPKAGKKKEKAKTKNMTAYALTEEMAFGLDT